ncbi:Uncharacterised protein [Kluyvera ascorbata]|nr:Uncharacterised protein [Kluyvera ascorbata]
MSQQQNSAKSNQYLQQIADNTRQNGSHSITINNNTGGNAVVTSTQLGGFG